MKKFLIKVNGNQYEVEVEEVKAGGAVSTPVETVKAAPAPVTAPTPKPVVEKNNAPSGASTITAPMPGTILKVNVANGDAVTKGQVLLILEAMKMENEIVASADGKIASVNVAKGSAVSVGDVLISIA